MPVPVAEIPLRVVFDDYEIQLDSGELTRAGERVKLAPQPAKVLALLVRRAGETVTREEIRAEIWNDGTVVEFDQGLNFCIRQIRSALGEDAKSPRYIETIPKRGYRFLRPVTPWEQAPATTEVKSPEGPGWTPQTWIPLVIASIVAGLFAAFWLWPKTRQPRTPGNPEAARLFAQAAKIEDEAGSMPKAAQLYLKVTELSPGFARGWAALANLEAQMVNGPPAQAAKYLADGERHAKKALALDDTSALAHAALGNVYWRLWRWEAAEHAFRRALALDANEPVAHEFYSLYLVSRGRKQEAIEHARRAVALAPASGMVNFALAMVLQQAGDFPGSIAQAKHTLEISRHFPWAYNILVPSNYLAGDLDAALRAQGEADQVKARSSDGITELPRAMIYARMGRMEEARELMSRYQTLRKPGGAIPETIARTWIALGDYDAAFAELTKAVEQHSGTVSFLKSSPALEPLRSDPRYPELLARMGNP